MSRRAGLLGLALALSVGCASPVPGPADGPHWLWQQVFTRSEEDGSLTGFVRSLYLNEDPGQVSQPELHCELWEEFSGAAVEPPGFCAECLGAWLLAVEYNTDDCGGLWVEPRTFTLGISELSAVSEFAELGSEGYSYGVFASSAPDTGDGIWEPLFAAQPLEWSDTPAQPVEGELLSGEWLLWSPYYYSLLDEGGPGSGALD